MNSRDKIIAAALAIRRKDRHASLSVRSVAAEAGVSVGTLRHFFPTQRDLRNAVFSELYANVYPDGDLYDRSVPAKDRLMARLQQRLATAGTLEQTIQIWNETYSRYFSLESTEAERTEFAEQGRHTIERISHWLNVLIEEGAMPDGNVEQRARFLLTVSTGILIDRVLPWEDPGLERETAILALAVEAVFGSSA
jgi:AcrR family transcriptional regulator